MRSTISTLLITGTIFIFTLNCDAQRKFEKEKIENLGLQEVKPFIGKVLAWEDNENYFNNGFYLQTGTEKLLVQFPTHLGSQLTSAITLGNTITVNGVKTNEPKKIQFVSTQINGKVIYNTPPIVQDRTIEKEFLVGSGKISELQTNKNGNVRSYVVDEKTILHISRNVASNLGKLAVIGAKIGYSGIKRNQQEGEVATANFTIIDCQTITINGKEYLAN